MVGSECVIDECVDTMITPRMDIARVICKHIVWNQRNSQQTSNWRPKTIWNWMGRWSGILYWRRRIIVVCNFRKIRKSFVVRLILLNGGKCLKCVLMAWRNEKPLGFNYSNALRKCYNSYANTQSTHRPRGKTRSSSWHTPFKSGTKWSRKYCIASH